jgi:hypothetical protein
VAFDVHFWTAAKQLQTQHWNTRSFERMRPKR